MTSVADLRASPGVSAIVGLVLYLLLLAGCSQSDVPEIVEFSGRTMGTTYMVKVAQMPSDLDRQAVADQIQATLDDVNQKMSTYIDSSELSRFNQAPPGTIMAVSADTFLVLQQSLDVWRRSRGAFDVTVGPLVNLWGFGPDAQPDRVPDEEQQQQAWARVGGDALVLHTETMSLEKRRDLYVDLSAIAKGYGVDKVALKLEDLGIRRYLVEVGGELRAGNRKSMGHPWRVAVEKPVPQLREIHRVIDISNMALATSGDYRNYFEAQGKRYSHTIDPRSGRPIDHHLVSATVVAPTCAEADAWATAMMVLGPEQGLDLANANNLAVYLLVKSAAGIESLHSRAFDVYLQDKLQ